MINELTVAAPAMAGMSLAASSSRSIGPVAAAHSHPTSVLLIEPNPDCADALSAILASLPRIDAVTVVADLGEATVSLRAGTLPPAIVLVDDQPGSSEILRAIDAIARLAPDSKLVLLCVYPQCVDRRVRERVDRCVTKDITRQELARVVDDVLRAA